MNQVGDKLETKKERFVAEIIGRDLSNNTYDIMVNGTKITLNVQSIELLFDQVAVNETALPDSSGLAEEIIEKPIAKPADKPIAKPKKKSIFNLKKLTPKKSKGKGKK